MFFSEISFAVIFALPNTNFLILIRQLITISIVVIVSSHSTTIRKGQNKFKIGVKFDPTLAVFFLLRGEPVLFF